MPKLQIVGISGSVRRPSRTTALVSTVLGTLEERLGGEARLIELVDAAPVLFGALTQDRLAGAAREIVDTVEQADVLVVGSPVYRASYTGALKHLFDLVHQDALVGKPVILAATAGTPLHGLVPDHQFRPLFGFFRAVTVPTTIFLTESDFRDYRIIEPSAARRIDRAVDEAAALFGAALPSRVSVRDVPRPLAVNG